MRSIAANSSTVRVYKSVIELTRPISKAFYEGYTEIPYIENAYPFFYSVMDKFRAAHVGAIKPCTLIGKRGTTYGTGIGIFYFFNIRRIFCKSFYLRDYLPLLVTTTLLPIFKFRALIMFGFARLALFTVVPARRTGSIRAMGV